MSTYKENPLFYYSERRKKIRALLSFYKETLGCAHCGEMNPIILQFHHIDPTSVKHYRHSYGRTSALSANGGNFAGIFAEVRKCIILCANCHTLEQSRLRAKLE